MFGGNTKSPVVEPLTGNTGAETPDGPNLTATDVEPVFNSATVLFWSLLELLILSSDVALAPTETA